MKIAQSRPVVIAGAALALLNVGNICRPLLLRRCDGDRANGEAHVAHNVHGAERATGWRLVAAAMRHDRGLLLLECEEVPDLRFGQVGRNSIDPQQPSPPRLHAVSR